MIVSEIFAQTPAERADFMREMGEPTHRGTPRSWVLEGHHEATRPPRTPTHRKPGPARVPAQFAHLATIREHLNG